MCFIGMYYHDAKHVHTRTDSGVRGFWSSNVANVVQCGPENAIAFTMFQVLRPHLCNDAQAPTVPEKFLLGSVAGSIAMTAVYPMSVVHRWASLHGFFFSSVHYR